MAKLARKNTVVKPPHGMNFEDVVRRVLKAGPMPRSKRRPKEKKATKVRPKVTK